RKRSAPTATRVGQAASAIDDPALHEPRPRHRPPRPRPTPARSPRTAPWPKYRGVVAAGKSSAGRAFAPTPRSVLYGAATTRTPDSSKSKISLLTRNPSTAP